MQHNATDFLQSIFKVSFAKDNLTIMKSVSNVLNFVAYNYSTDILPVLFSYLWLSFC